ncbi:undecaprenyl-diphosphate phosphatase [Fictibacillus aquaticus]|uniref:Undecaprenyl-diphosphatase n=1 Tax=Fictibacillus aquaticus TaxID=2021314 RepID=A0A235F3U6_9BACL|nr:undecaprenyl-diphosphate phosphatase [Fictibacillus aquaticus]OYD55946.1 undecaprenyl-diphosphatase [Fictibacillus aquaticus]
MDFLLLLKAIILGIVEGLTEFAPVSSTGHMILVDDMWLKSKEFLGKYPANTFKVVIQLGSILAVVIVFWKRFMDMLALRSLFKKNKTLVDKAEQQQRLKLSQVIVGLLPAGILGVLFEDYIDEHLFTMNTVLIGLVIGAVFMIIADIAGPKTPLVHTVDEISYKQAFFVGLFQCFSLWPGFSRSGSTISGGVILGLSHRAAADFTFIMAVPIMAGASLISLLKNWQYFNVDYLPFFLAGFVSAFIFALISIRFFLAVITKVRLIPFAIYRIVLAGAIYLLFF